MLPTILQANNKTVLTAPKKLAQINFLSNNSGNKPLKSTKPSTTKEGGSGKPKHRKIIIAANKTLNKFDDFAVKNPENESPRHANKLRSSSHASKKNKVKLQRLDRSKANL